MNDDISDQEIHVYHGLPYMTEQLGELKFNIGAKSFFQTNSRQAKVLYDVVKDFAQIKLTDVVYDLYTGTGTIANYVAPLATHVVGLEYIEQAIVNAKENSILNKIENTSFIAGDIASIFNDALITLHGAPDIVITDPPRAGMHPDVITQLLKVQPQRIVYVSCNVATQSRDIEMMSKKYNVLIAQPVDMFPHTHHVENVLLMELKRDII